MVNKKQQITKMSNCDDPSAISVLEADIKSYGLPLTSQNWEAVKAKVSSYKARKKQVIFSQAIVCDKMLFVTKGIVASEQNHPDGTAAIARFFKSGNLCSNVSSALLNDYANDTLFAATDIQGVMFPIQYFLEEYESGGPFGQYLRKKILETLLFDKEILCTKTLLDSEYRYQFLEQKQPEVIRLVSDKYIARFIGITPQGFSRFLRNRKSVS